MESNKFKNKRIALVYDRINKWGGAERVLLAFHELFPDAPLYTSVYNPDRAKWAKVFNIRTSFLQNFPRASSSHELYVTLMPLAFESFNFDEYDVVISITSEAAKGIITKPKTLHICYCLTPTRYLWSGYDDYFKNNTSKFLSKPAISYLRFWDKVACQRPDAYIAISEEVQDRIKKYYGRDSFLVYPPLSIESNSGNDDKIGNYFLLVARLVPYKKADVAIEAFNNLKLPLKVIGSGTEIKKLRKIAKPNIEFLSNLTDEELIGYYKNCSAFVFPGREDFGLAILEAQSFGKPVIAYRGGGASEIVIEGETGEFFDKQKAEALAEKVVAFNNSKYSRQKCIERAHQFSKKRFQEQIQLTIYRFLEGKN
ncbi:MAG: glycosyltransferase [bacterium]|nr:glycosyltransferase [bacterium]